MLRLPHDFLPQPVDSASGELVSTIATTLGVSRATVYRVLAEQSVETVD